jgi:hypothetical protein
MECCQGVLGVRVNTHTLATTFLPPLLSGRFRGIRGDFADGFPLASTFLLLPEFNCFKRLRNNSCFKNVSPFPFLLVSWRLNFSLFLRHQRAN